MSFVVAMALVVVSLAGAAPANAQSWPSRPIKIVVPYPPGGPSDFMGRLVAQKLQEELKVTVVVDNRSGASGTIGADYVRQAPADGYTFLCSVGAHILARQFLKSVPYDPVDDFTPIARFGEGPLALIANPAALPVQTISAALPIIRKAPKDFRIAQSSTGAVPATLEFNKMTNLDLQVIPYRGSAPAITDLISGQVQLMIDPVLTALPLVQSGQIKILAVASDRRSSVLPDVPTAAESGLPGFDFSSWNGIWGPKNLPKDIVSKINAVVNRAVKDKAFVERLATMGVEPVESTPEEFDRYIKSNVARTAELLRAANFEPQ